MVRLQLDERQWHRIETALGARKGAGRPGRDDRNFVEAVLWWRRTGAPWRDLPSEFGPSAVRYSGYGCEPTLRNSEPT